MFVAAIFLYNRTTTSSLAEASPYKELHDESPNVRDLRIFRCTAYPNLCLFNRNKFSNRSSAHIFIGYPANTKGYLCYNPENGKIVISRDVLFLEKDFLAAATLLVPSDCEDLIPNSYPIGILSNPAPVDVAAPNSGQNEVSKLPTPDVLPLES